MLKASIFQQIISNRLALHELIGILHLYAFSRPQDLHSPFGQFGLLKDVYLPRDYYTGYVFFHWLKHGSLCVERFLGSHF